MSTRPYNLFISYAHKNEAVKDRLLGHLKLLKRNGLVHTWDDRAIPAGSDWRAEIESAMATADAAVFLLDEYFLASDFCMDVEVERFLQRHREGKVLILFVLTDHCGWKRLGYINRFQLLPRDARPISSFTPRSKAYTAVLEEMEQALLDHRDENGLPDRASVPAVDTQPGDELAALLEKLPGQTPHLFGRHRELQLLDGWRSRRGVFLWVAPGGMGKSALTRWWLESYDWPPGTRFIGHSFYSQGSHNQTTSARGFLTGALERLGVAYQANAADDELGRLLAAEAALAPTVLLLDGLEPLQRAAPGDDQLHGTFKDRGLGVLLETLARDPGQAVCLASSRLPISDIAIRDAPAFRWRELAALHPAGALELLQRRGLKGGEEELAQVAERCGHHPLALVLVAEFCHSFLDDSAAAFLEREWPQEIGEQHAATVMGWLDRELDTERQSLDRELLRCIGLFDRPAPWGALQALKNQEPPIPGVTERLHQADEEDLMEALARLRQWGLVQVDLIRTEPDLDAHPLVREHFGAGLERRDPAAYRAAHRVLFDWFRGLPALEQPDTLEELEPLYRALGHGCRAGAYATALNKVYRDRIQRGNQGYSGFHLGAWSSDLAALAGFFPGGWGVPPVRGEGGEVLGEAARSWLLGETAFCLMAMGRLEEALGPQGMVRKRTKEAGDWDNFCRSSNGLMDLLTPLGRWSEAEIVAREVLEAAVQIEDQETRWQRTMIAEAYLGRVLHGQGRLGEALAIFGRAEAEQAEIHQHPRLYGIQGFGYAQLLLERACRPSAQREVLERGGYALEISEKTAHLLSQALDYCTIGQGLAKLGRIDGASGAVAALDQAVATMQRAGTIFFQPIPHLARAHNHHRFGDDPDSAWHDHAAALTIARRGNMRTYLAECALLAGNLHLDADEVPQAAAQHAEAARLIREDGYGRREAELHLLHARLLHHEADPAAARAALQTAEARICEIRQWGLWNELHRVGEEIGVAVPEECPPEADESESP